MIIEPKYMNVKTTYGQSEENQSYNKTLWERIGLSEYSERNKNWICKIETCARQENTIPKIRRRITAIRKNRKLGNIITAICPYCENIHKTWLAPNTLRNQRAKTQMAPMQMSTTKLKTYAIPNLETHNTTNNMRLRNNVYKAEKVQAENQILKQRNKQTRNKNQA